MPLTIEAVPGSAPGSVTIDDTGFTGANQGIITNNSSLTVNGLVLKGAATAPGFGNNAGAIRDHSSSSLTVLNSILEDSQNGILTDDPTRAEQITVKGSTFLQDGFGDGQTHALYVGGALSLDVEASVFCGTNNGHDVKSRATTTTVSGSTMYIGATGPGCAVAGSTGAGVDLPNGGVADLENDSLIQGGANMNGALVIVGGESPLLAINSLTINNSNLEGDGNPASIGVNELSGCIAPVQGSGNTVTNLGTTISPAGCGTLGTVSAVDEPSPFWLLLTALGGAGWMAAQRRRYHRAIQG